MKPTHDIGAKSTYASSTTTTPVDASITFSTATDPAQVPVGEFGLTMNLSGAGSSAKSWDQIPSRPVACGAGERAEAHLDELVAAVAERDLLRLHMVVSRDGAARGRRGRARIKTQLVVGRIADRLQHSR